MCIKQTLILIGILIYASTAYAGDVNDIINREIFRRDQIIKENVSKFGVYEAAAAKEIQDNQLLIESIKAHQTGANAANLIKAPPKAVVFVSFTMPQLSLQQIIQDAARYQIPIIIRGLHKNSFRDTAEKIFNLVKEKQNGGVLINPIWFKKYAIKSVPAVVVNFGDKSDILYGNIPLKKALSIIAEQGEATAVAKSILEEHEHD